MELQFIFAGFGGQGVLTAGQILAYAAMLENKSVSWMPSYGAEMRGGAANCGVVISDEQGGIGSPVVSNPDVLAALNNPSLILFEKEVRPGGTLIYNSSIIDQIPTRTDIKIIPVPCNEIATELGNDRVLNIVALGAVIAASGLVSSASAIEAIKQYFGESKLHLLELNKKALEKGIESVNK